MYSEQLISATKDVEIIMKDAISLPISDLEYIDLIQRLVPNKDTAPLTKL